MDRFEIWNVAHSWNGCDDLRPWLIVDFGQNGLVGCFPIATECYVGSCFYIDENDPDFLTTRLAHSSNIHDSHIIDIPGNSFRSRRGELTGAMLQAFRDQAGV